MKKSAAELAERGGELAQRTLSLIKRMHRTYMLKRYELQFGMRLVVFLVVLFFYLTRKQDFYGLVMRPFWRGISPIHLLWAYFMIIMISHLIPREKLSMAVMKAYTESRRQSPTTEHDELELLRFVKTQNIRAWVVMLVWLIFNGIFAGLYLFGVLDEADMLMLTTFYFLSDYICILFFCPFQTFIMKNKCCINCRIYDWGHFMMFTPMLFIKNFFSWSLFFTSCVVLIKWEIVYARHPERFWHESNPKLQCENCREQLCHYKKKRQLMNQLSRILKNKKEETAR